MIIANAIPYEASLFHWFMGADYNGFYDTCPIHEESKHGEGIAYYVDWRTRGQEVIGNYFPCCGTICLKSSKQNYESVMRYRQGLQSRQPSKTNLWVSEAIEGDIDIWRERGEIDATYGFGTNIEGVRPKYQVHEAITYLHTIDESIGETVLNQFFMAEPHALFWEMDDLMASETMGDDIRKHFNVGLFGLIYRQGQKDAYLKQSIEWLERHSLITPDPLRATQALFRLKAQLKQLPETITLSYLNTIIEHTNDAGFDVEEDEISAWLKELSVYGVDFDKSKIHPDFIP